MCQPAGGGAIAIRQQALQAIGIFFTPVEEALEQLEILVALAGKRTQPLGDVDAGIRLQSS